MTEHNVNIVINLNLAQTLASYIISFSLMSDDDVYPYFMLHRLKAAEECFRQAKEKSAYSVKPKHASGIVS